MSALRRHLACTPAFASATTRASAARGRYLQRNLVADTVETGAENIDPNLVNPWGLAFDPTGVAWLSDHRTGVSTLYDGDGHPQALVVTVPPAVGGEDSRGKPTGLAWNGGPEFVVRQGPLSGPARCIFVSEDGGLAAWAPSVDAARAVRVFPHAFANNAVFTGLAIGADGERALLYAADFRNNRVDVFDTDFSWIILAGNPFVDPQLAPGYAPFGIQAINGDIYVTYARQQAGGDGIDRLRPAQGGGCVSVFTPDGRFVRRLASDGVLNQPWGLALAPAGFGSLGNRLLVANAGDGAIHAVDIASGELAGSLCGADGRAIAIEGLRAIGFGNGLAHQPVDTLFFCAGPGDGNHGLYGRLDAVPTGEHQRQHDGAGKFG